MMTQPHPGSDDPGDLLRRFATGEHAALDGLYRLCADRAWNQARRLLGDGADAEDAVQEAFLQLARSAGRFDGRVPFGAWLGQLVHEAALQVRRARQRRQQREDAVRSQMDSTTREQGRIDEELVRHAVAELSPADQRAIDLHYFAGLDLAETAAALGISGNAAGVRLHRARDRLRGILRRRGLAAAQVALLVGALDNLPAASAPPAVLARAGQLAGQAADGTLPASTLPASGGMGIGVAIAVAAGLIAASGLGAWAFLGGRTAPPSPPAAAAAAEREPAPAPPPGLEPGWRDPAARQLLHQADASAWVSCGIDWQEVVRTGARSKPGTLFTDPRTQAWQAHIRSQFADYAAHDPRQPRWDRLVEGSAGVVMTAWPGKPESFAGAVGLGDEADGMRRLIGRDGGTPPLAANPFGTDWTAWTDLGGDTQAVSARQRRLLVGGRNNRLQANEATANERPPLPAPIWAVVDGRPTFAALDRDGSDPLAIATWLGQGWQKRQPRLETMGWLPADGPLFRTTLRDLPLPLRTPAPALWRRWRGGALVSLALGSDALGRIAAAVEAPPAARAAIAAADGDILVQAFPGAPLPIVVATLLRHGSDEPWTAIARTLGLIADPARPGAFAGLVKGLQVGLTLEADAVVITIGDASRLPAAAAAPPPAALLAQADLATLGRTWLPMLQAAIGRECQPFDTPLTSHWGTFQIFRTAIGEQWKGGPPLSLRELATSMKQEPEQPRLDRILPADRLDRLIAILMPVMGGRATWTEARTVLHFSDGWRVLSFGRGRQAMLPLDRTRMLAAIKGLTRIAGGDPEQLEVMPLPPPPGLDARWLPPIAVLADHLPAWSLRVETDTQGARIEEHGLPLGHATMVAFLPRLAFAADGFRLAAEYRRDVPSVRKRHTTRIAALEAVSRRIRPKPGTFDLPDHLSAILVTETDRALLAPFFNGATPTAEQVDSLGTWSPTCFLFLQTSGSSHPGAANFLGWIVELEPGWHAGLADMQRQDRVVVSNLPFDRVTEGKKTVITTGPAQPPTGF